MSTQTAIRERPILMSGPMVRAILEGRKTVTRRVVKHHLPTGPCDVRDIGNGPEIYGAGGVWLPLKCPYGKPGDRLWVRETWRETYDIDGTPVMEYRAGGTRLIDGKSIHHGQHRATSVLPKWRPSIHMPRWASRITLPLLDVRVERVQEITEADAIAEGLISQAGDGGRPGAGFKWRGIGYHGGSVGEWGREYHTPDQRGRCSCHVGGPSPAQCAFRELWDRLNESRGFSWEANPLVWRIEFKVTP